ncbi:hypothetical protein BGZ61DRAFT_487203 [Ilyonectria robusta]|uniref:uncharacterized protein n=1 Tax=Ilyonectria robusta TaxID=1079257 RepID=UPI001E8DCB70|nr:uncharacterized protein BGZ61DRAFT_487203 [Ilyonectria robusta]KAH8654173.1 hypothetical protein BGZ61DRAFT_487203 [Ilyonectria robusta]
MDYSLSSVRGLILEIGPEYLATMMLPRAKTPDLEKLEKSMNSNHELLRSRIVELTPEFRVVLPKRKDHDNVITIQTLVEGKSAEETGEAWQVAIQGPSSRMMDICRRLRNEDESARNAIICHARGEEMDFRGKCEECHWQQRYELLSHFGVILRAMITSFPAFLDNATFLSFSDHIAGPVTTIPVPGTHKAPAPVRRRRTAASGSSRLHHV